MNSEILKSARDLTARGFTVHWLRHNSKIPLQAGWSKKPTRSFDDLMKEYRVGCNVGIVLGRPFNDGFICAIDCDVKSSDPRHQREMTDALKSHFGGSIFDAPVSWSGRQNGSRHILVKTREVAKNGKITQSSEVVKVTMPSVAPSENEKKVLTPDELQAGVRLRAAWEIEFMSSGRQIVAPPSVHPDTGRFYSWGDISLDKIPMIDAPAFGDDRELKSKTNEIDVNLLSEFDADVDLFGLDDATTRLIVECDVADRSAALMTACRALVKAGFTDTEILSILTDREKYALASIGFDHRKTESRARAAAWIRDHTLKKAKDSVSAEKAFDCEIEEKTLAPDAADAQKTELLEASDWTTGLSRTKNGAVKNTLLNVEMILANAIDGEVFRLNEFTGFDVYGISTEWGGRAGSEISDRDVTLIEKWIAERFGFEPSTNNVNKAISTIAYENRYHPIREYLKSLKWDGVARIDSWLKTYCEAEAEEPYLSAVSRKTLVAMVKRVMQPGCKFDQILILEGAQGIGKSTALRHLASDDLFSDAHINIGDKDAILLSRVAWLMELGELSGMRKADVDHLKEFISRGSDRVRVPYGKRVEVFPRQCVFVGTTNSSEYLRDTTGNRRFWPVTVGNCDFDAIKRDRDQLFAEAVVAYDFGEPLYLEEADAQVAARREQSQREEHDALMELIEAWVNVEPSGDDKIDRTKFSMTDLIGVFGPLHGVVKNTMADQKRVAACLRKLGYVKKDFLIDGSGRKRWFKA